MFRIILEFKCVGWFRKGINYLGINICIYDELKDVFIIVVLVIGIFCGTLNGCFYVRVIVLLNKSEWDDFDFVY